MRQLTIALAFLLAACSRQPETNGNLTVPEGFTVEIVAAAPLVERPMIIDADNRGRLYVAESSGANYDVKQQAIDRPHSILQLTDTDGDGKYDQRTVFADKMMLPEGVLWHDGSVYVGAPPIIWKLTDTDDDGVADQREEWYDAKTLTGCANDLHGPYLGRDGWIYWTKGAFAEQTYERPGREPLVTKAAHIFRRRPEGGPVEAVLTGGMDNPVEVAFTPEGERFLTSTFIEHPRLGRRDGLLHAVYGGVYGKIHGVTDGHPMTGGFNEVMTHFGPSAPVGLTYYDSLAFPQDYYGNLFTTHFNMHKVTRHVLQPEGAGFVTKDEDFLVSDSIDFHPTDVMTDGDGSLLVVDTGGWYKICCPTSQLAKEDVLGAIYRIRRVDGTPIDDPYGNEMDWNAPSEEIIPRVGPFGPVVTERAVSELARREDVDALGAALADKQWQRRNPNTVWALTRIDRPEARAAVRTALVPESGGDAVTQAALHSAGLWRDAEAPAIILKHFAEYAPPRQRAAAEALGRIGDPAAVPALLDAIAKTEDATLTHSLTYALIEIAHPNSTRAGLTANSPKTRRAALIALDQMRPRSLEPSTVIPLLSQSDEVLTPTAEWIVAQHPEWGPQLAGYFREQLRTASADKRPILAQRLADFSGTPAIQQLIATTASRGTPSARLTALAALAEATPEELPKPWVAALPNLLAQPEPIAAAAVRGARNLRGEEPLPALDDAFIEAASNESNEAETRVLALEAVADTLETLPASLFGYLRQQAAPGKPATIRLPAARTLAKADLSEPQIAQLAELLPAAGPMELPHLVEALGDGKSQSLGQKWVTALGEARGLANLRPDIVETAAANYPESVQTAAAKILGNRATDREAQRQHFEQLLASLGEGDIRRGQQVFNSEESACSACHAIGYKGGQIGPGLTRIGEVRTRRDLLEAVVYPSASFVRSYEPLTVVTEMDIHNGVPIEESDTHMLLATGPHEEVRLARADIQEVRPGTVSIMPSGLADQLTQQQLADLLTFLENTRWR